MIKAGIVGAAGYTAGELIRILYRHPDIDLSFLQSDSNAGQAINSVHGDLFYASHLKFTKDIDDRVDVLFLCKGHGESARLLESATFDTSLRIIDLSQDFRVPEKYPGVQSKYGSFVYGLPELNRDKIIKAKNIANPGCFATCIQLGLLPLAKDRLLSGEIHISAITGSTGAGQEFTSTSHFSWRNNNMSVYKPFTHQHLHEIHNSLKQLDPESKHKIYFIPYRGNFTRGIIATMYVSLETTKEEIVSMFSAFYESTPFVHISDVNIDLKQVVNTNFCQLFVEKIEGQVMIVSTIDNLLKGASGQAVQNMNLMLGLDETTGLNFKGTAF